MRAFPLCVFLLSLLACPAQAEWRKLGFAAQLSGTTQQLNTIGPLPQSPFASASGFYYFDTTAPAVQRTDTSVEFAIQDHEVAVTTMVEFRTTQRVFRPQNSTSKVVYDGTNDSLTFVLNATEGEPLELRFQIVNPVGPFTASMDTLPANGYGTFGSVFSVLESDEDSFQAIWLAPNNIFLVGAVQYTLGGPPGPPDPRPCSPADLAPPFGILNFFDLQEYLQIFSKGCP